MPSGTSASSSQVAKLRRRAWKSMACPAYFVEHPARARSARRARALCGRWCFPSHRGAGDGCRLRSCRPTNSTKPPSPRTEHAERRAGGSAAPVGMPVLRRANLLGVELLVDVEQRDRAIEIHVRDRQAECLAVPHANQERYHVSRTPFLRDRRAGRGHAGAGLLARIEGRAGSHPYAPRSAGLGPERPRRGAAPWPSPGSSR